MDTYRKRSITTLRIAGAMLFALCFATETLRSGNIDCHQRCIGNVHNSCDGNSRHNNRSFGYGNASEHRRRTYQRIKHRMDDACSHAGILHAAGIRTGTKPVSHE